MVIAVTLCLLMLFMVIAEYFRVNIIVQGVREDVYKRQDYHDICFPCTKEARQQFNDAVLDAYEQSFRQPQQTNHAPAAEQTM